MDRTHTWQTAAALDERDDYRGDPYIPGRPAYSRPRLSGSVERVTLRRAQYRADISGGPIHLRLQPADVGRFCGVEGGRKWPTNAYTSRARCWRGRSGSGNSCAWRDCVCDVVRRGVAVAEGLSGRRRCSDRCGGSPIAAAANPSDVLEHQFEPEPHRALIRGPAVAVEHGRDLPEGR